MKKSLITILIVFVMLAAFQFTSVMATGERMTHVKTTNAATPKILVKTGAFTVTGMQVLYNSLTTTGQTGGTLHRLGLYDCSNTYTATAWKVTITVTSPLVSNDNYIKLGDWYMSQNGSGYGIISGVTFTAGVVLDASLDGDVGGGITTTVAVLGI
jgi:hypothetical protein